MNGRLPYSAHSKRSSQAVRRLMVLLLAFVVAGSGIVAYLLYIRPVLAAVHEATGQAVPRAAVVQAGAAPKPAPTLSSLSGTSRINVLLLGSDTDAKFSGVYDTQIMIVVSIDPASKRVVMLSIPRDLWVPIRGFGVGKVGTAYHDGGLALARQTIEQDFGIPIHFYAWVGLDGFIKVIDTFGGVDVDVSHPVVDDAYPDDVNSPDPYAYRRLYIPAGPQHLDGTQALEYVRSRHGDLIGDFGRSKRQQQVLDALRGKASGREIVAKLPSLANDLKDYVRTDMTLPDLVKLAGFADQIRSQPVGQYTLAPTKYSQEGTSADGQSIVIPNWPAIRSLVDTLFGLKTAATLPDYRPVGLASQQTPTATAAARTPSPTASTKRPAVTPTVAARRTAVATPAKTATPVKRGIRQPIPSTGTTPVALR